MAQQMSSTYQRAIAFLGIGAALMLGLTGCLGGNGAKVTEDLDMFEDAATSPAPSPTDAQSASASSSQAAPPAADGELTAPGTTLKFGDIAKTHSNSDKPDAEDHKEASFDTTVTKIVAGDPADLDKFDNPEKFAGLTPHYVFVESTLTSVSKPTAGLSASFVDARLEDGTGAQKLIFFGSLDGCESEFFETEGVGDPLSYVVGSTQTTCTVFVAPTGSGVTSATYTDSAFNYANYSDSPYLDNPIVWGK